MPEPVYTPVIPDRTVRLRSSRLRAHYDAGGRPALWDAVRRALIEEVGPRASCPDEVAALRAWIDLEHEPTYAYFLGRFEARATEDNEEGDSE
jgi:hypothetical protein